MKYLEERDIGFDVGVTKVPLVVQSCIFDLVIGDKNARPDGKMAYKACENASYDTFLQGNYGAGMGATVGKYMGRERQDDTFFHLISILFLGLFLFEQYHVLYVRGMREHVECCHTGNHCHEPAHEWRELEAS